MAPTSHPPASWLYPKVTLCYRLGYNDKEITEEIKAEIAKNPDFAGKRYSMSSSGIFRVRGKIGLKGTRQQKKSPNAYASLPAFIKSIRPAYPDSGARSLVVTLRWEHGIKIPEVDLRDILRVIEPEKVAGRKGARFKRSRFYSAGVMEIFSFDQHDKWKYFGLYMHLGMDPYTGMLHWNKIWWTNRNTALVTSYYLEAARKQKAVPLLTFSDTGRENNGIAKCHSTIRQRLDHSLRGTIQHKWHYDKMNIKSEISWGRIRRGFSRGFEALLEDGETRGLIDFPNRDPLEMFLFRWLFIPYLQNELDVWTERQNNSMRRSYKHKILPHGIPSQIHANPGKWQGKNFAVQVPDALFDEMEALWSPPDDPVFQLTPPSFDAHIQRLYEEIGSPVVAFNNIWDIYSQLQELFERDLDATSRDALATALRSHDANFEADVEIVELPIGGEDEDEEFFDERLFTDDEDDGHDSDIEYEIVLTEDEDDFEVEEYLQTEQDSD